MKLLKGNRPGGIFLDSASELQIAIDFTHDPWRTLAIKMLHFLNEELNEMDFGIAGVNEMIEIIHDTKGDLQ